MPHDHRRAAGRRRRGRTSRTARTSFILIVAAAGAIATYAVVRVTDPGGAVRDARYVEFRASPDHADVAQDGAPLVRGYVLEIFPAGASTAVQTIDLGKPSPSPEGVIRIALSSLPVGALAPGATYEAAVKAVGPHGSGTSNRSNRFSFSAPR
jgi:hypothetical protein